MALKIGFIFPSSDYLFDPFRGDPHTHFQILTVIEAALGNNVDLSLIDLRGIKKEFAVYHIHECDLFLHSVYTLDFQEQVAIVKKLRERYPQAQHIAGGPHATVFQEEAHGVFDSLIIGDGEESIIEAIKDHLQGALKKIYTQKNFIDINKYPIPSRKYLPEATIARKGLLTLKNKPGYDQIMSTTVNFSRGCPFNCAFCAMPQIRGMNPGIRFRSPELVEAEIEYLKSRYGIQGISLLDEIGFPMVREGAIARIEAIGRTGITWRGQCRVDGVTPELAKLARQAGCVTLCLGVESASQTALDAINKKITVRQARDAVKIIREAGIECRIYMIIGLPGEPENIVDLTWTFIQETGPDLVFLSLFTIRPGTEVYLNPEKFGIKKIFSDWENTMHMYSRYADEMPRLTFEYSEQTPWGKSFESQQIVGNYLELQEKLKQANMCSLAQPPKA